MLTKRTKMQLAVFVVVSVVGAAFISFGYAKLPDLLFGIGHYTVTVELPAAAGLYPRSNVTYRGTEVGQVKDVHLTESGVEAVLSLKSNVKIPSDLNAEVHSQSAIGEQYLALLPQKATSRPLRDGDVVPVTHTSVPPDINSLLDAANRGLDAIPGDNLQTAVNEAYTAVGGLGPDIARFVKGSTTLAIDARKNVNDLTNVVDNIGPILDTQTDSSDSLQIWATHLATITRSLQKHDSAVAGVLQKGGPTAEELRSLFQRLQPTLPVLLANVVSVGQVAVTYRDNLEQLLVLLPQGAADMQGIGVPNRNTKLSYRGGYLSFNLNLNLPPPCTTGFLPATQARVTSLVDYPPFPQGDLYCRVPQDSIYNVRGARNTPCVTRPGKRAPTVKMCESDENYVPLNDGENWKGDPNATLSGQGIPQLPPGVPAAGAVAAPPPPPAPPPIAAATYDPATGQYIGPDGHMYSQSNLTHNADKDPTWQKMLLPPGN
jgi:phospholipid/cholesterol/gamma-HCH transport system substrate-binding protein